MLDLIPPAVFMIVAALLIGPARGHLRSAIVLFAPLVTLWFIWQVPDGVAYDVGFLDYRIEPLEGSAVRRLFATIFAIMAFVGGLFAFRQAKWYELAAAYAYAAGAIGVSFAGDLITLFLFWELMALFSTVVVWCGGTPEARQAGIRYAIMHLLGGVILKVGIEGVMVHTSSIEVRPMLADNFEHWMILIVILIVGSREGRLSPRIFRTVIRGLLANPMIVSIALGLGYASTGLAIPGPVAEFLAILGAAATPGALFAIGASLASKSAERMGVAVWLSTSDRGGCLSAARRSASRRRKRRSGKPFAVLYPDLDTLRRHVDVPSFAEPSLTGMQAPIGGTVLEFVFAAQPGIEAGFVPEQLAVRDATKGPLIEPAATAGPHQVRGLVRQLEVRQAAPIPFQHGELRVVVTPGFAGAKDPAHFIDVPQAGREQALEHEFGRRAQVAVVGRDHAFDIRVDVAGRADDGRFDFEDIAFGEKGADIAKLDGEAAFDLAGDDTGDDFIRFVGCFE